MEVNININHQDSLENPMDSFLILRNICPEENRYRSYSIQIKTLILKGEVHYAIVLAWGRIGVKKRRLSYICTSREEVDRLLKPVLQTRLRHHYKIMEKGKKFPEYKILNEFQKGKAIDSRQLLLFN